MKLQVKYHSNYDYKDLTKPFQSVSLVTDSVALFTENYDEEVLIRLFFGVCPEITISLTKKDKHFTKDLEILKGLRGDIDHSWLRNPAGGKPYLGNSCCCFSVCFLNIERLE
jgi:hypothetical protein